MYLNKTLIITYCMLFMLSNCTSPTVGIRTPTQITINYDDDDELRKVSDMAMQYCNSMGKDPYLREIITPHPTETLVNNLTTIVKDIKEGNSKPLDVTKTAIFDCINRNQH